MEERRITQEVLEAFEVYLTENEKSEATLSKYMRDIRHFALYAANRPIDKALTLAYKAQLSEGYALSSANSMLAALNAFFHFAGWKECCVKQFKIQRPIYCPEEKELTKAEYVRLIHAAEEGKNKRISLVIQTICGTGIRVGELKYITVEAVQRGKAEVSCKGKTRTIFIVSTLRKKLLQYAKRQGVQRGVIFVTKNGKPLNRSNIWREMKALCQQADVPAEKVFPHNLRHLFARAFYSLEKDIAKLADILGHASINTTRIYIMTTGAEHKRRMESLRLIL